MTASVRPDSSNIGVQLSLGKVSAFFHNGIPKQVSVNGMANRLLLGFSTVRLAAERGLEKGKLCTFEVDATYHQTKHSGNS